MRTSIDKWTIERALGALVPLCDGRSLPLLGNVHLEASAGGITLRATDMMVERMVRVPAECDGEASVLVPGKLMHQAVRAIPSEVVTIVIDGVSVSLSSGSSGTFRLEGLSPLDYPPPRGVVTDGIRIDLGPLTAAIDAVIHAASRDQGRSAICGVRVEPDTDGVVVIATDGYRLAVEAVPKISITGIGEGVTIPTRTAQALSGVAVEGEIEADQSRITVAFDRDILTSGLIASPFPDWRRVAGAHEGVVCRVQRDDLRGAISRALLVADDPPAVDIGGDGSLITVSAGSRSGYSEQVSCSGSDLEVRMNGRYLLEALSSLPDGELAISCRSGGAVRIDAGGESARYVMPMRR